MNYPDALQMVASCTGCTFMRVFITGRGFLIFGGGTHPFLKVLGYACRVDSVLVFSEVGICSKTCNKGLLNVKSSELIGNRHNGQTPLSLTEQALQMFCSQQGISIGLWSAWFVKSS
jgi:hypothetical protein